MSQSNQRSSSSSGANAGCRGRERGMPMNCRCGEVSVMRTSKTSNNPGRLFHCCPNGSEGDKYHLFKWTDEGVVEEIEDFKHVISDLKEEMENLQFETRSCEVVVSCFEKEMKELKEVLARCEKDVKEVVKEIHYLKSLIVAGMFMVVFYYCFVA